MSGDEEIDQQRGGAIGTERARGRRASRQLLPPSAPPHLVPASRVARSQAEPGRAPLSRSSRSRSRGATPEGRGDRRYYRSVVDSIFQGKLSEEDLEHVKKCATELGAKINKLQNVNKRRKATEDDIVALREGRWPAGVKPYSASYATPFLEERLTEDFTLTIRIPSGKTYSEGKEDIYRQCMIAQKQMDDKVGSLQRADLKSFCKLEAFTTRCTNNVTRQISALQALDLDLDTETDTDVKAKITENAKVFLYNMCIQTAMNFKVAAASVAAPETATAIGGAIAAAQASEKQGQDEDQGRNRKDGRDSGGGGDSGPEGQPGMGDWKQERAKANWDAACYGSEYLSITKGELLQVQHNLEDAGADRAFAFSIQRGNSGFIPPRFSEGLPD